MSRPPITPQLADTGIVAILRASGSEYVRRAAVTLAEAGITCLELTMTTPDAEHALSELRTALPDAVAVGMGSVTTPEQAAAAVHAGAEFLVSPVVCLEVADAAAALEVPWYPGAWTPTEVVQAWSLSGVAAVKLFPASSGGPRHLRDIRAPLPDIPLVPTGGVAIDQIGDYLVAGAAGVGLGGPLLGDALEGGSLDGLRDRAERALDAVRDARSR
jgi:2-dehydro-3-deoxyphosphogluconate aldolase/(4S)-4-hydroxy-2-oxoglutarate aldolase